MRLKHQWWSVLVAAVLSGLVGVTAVAAAGEQFLPVLGVREGGQRFVAIPRADGFIAYLTLLNARDGGINGVHLGLGRVRNRLRRRPRRGVLRAPESQGAHGGGGGSAARHPDRLCPDGAGHARQDPPAHGGLWARGRRGWAGVSVCLQPPDQLLESEHGQDPLHRPAGWRHGPAQGPENRPCLPRNDYGRETMPILDTQAAQYGFAVQHLAVQPPGLDQKATWLRVKVAQPDWVILRSTAAS